ncbi:MAG: GMC family oxidoreductase N-terminal domain-containing protein, partial [Halieaceae bacterium]|nr:GMC family oxidoreductase N-terminal domain-containing protein [Halieaceae bacterium]
LGFAFLLKEHANNWNYRTQPEPGLNQRQVALPRGKVLGGCSAINGMVYIRGQARDFDGWAALGNSGWSYEKVLPYFKRSEDCESGDSAFHGRGGPLWVGSINNEFPLCDAFIAAAVEQGHQRNHDFNGAQQYGVGFFPHNIRNGRRLSSAGAFLGAGKALNNLTVISHAEAQRVVFDGDRATGLACRVRGKPVTFTATREVILCGGAINSPRLLELSGVGQADRLQQHGIAVIRDLPGVGENLQDHWNAYIKRSTDQGRTYYSESRPLAMARNLSRYIFRRQGLLANPAALVAVFYPALDVPDADAQIHFAPAASEVDVAGNMVPIDGITISTCGLRPSSRGHTHIGSAQPHQAPHIQVNYLQTEHDQQVAVAALKKAREICASRALAEYGGQELLPGEDLTSDQDLLDCIRTTGEPVHHLAGSCKMGSDDQAVVNERLQVHGLQGLRVADASIMPTIVSGNTHAACVMIGEKAADMILEEQG